MVTGIVLVRGGALVGEQQQQILVRGGSAKDVGEGGSSAFK